MPAATDYASQLANFIEPEVTSQINRACLLTQILPKFVGGTKGMEWDVRTGTGVGAAVADGADAPSVQSDTKTKASLPWARYADTISLTGDLLDIAASSPSPTELLDAFGEELMEASERMAAGIHAHSFTGNTGASPNELNGLIHSSTGALLSTGTYATINKASVTLFQGNELANGGVTRPLTRKLLSDSMTAMKKTFGVVCDAIVASPGQWQAYGDTQVQTKQHTQEVVMRGQKIMLDGGYQALMLDGVPMFWDKGCPDTDVLFLNTRVVGYKVLPPGGRNAMTSYDGEVSLSGTPEMQLGQRETGLRANLIKLAKTGDKQAFEVISKLLLYVKRPNACAVLRDLRLA